MKHPHIELTGVCAHTAGNRVLFEDLNLDMSCGRVALVGRNGVGKSTLLRMVSGQECPRWGAGGHKPRSGFPPSFHRRAGTSAGDILDPGPAGERAAPTGMDPPGMCPSGVGIARGPGPARAHESWRTSKKCGCCWPNLETQKSCFSMSPNKTSISRGLSG